MSHRARRWRKCWSYRMWRAEINWQKEHAPSASRGWLLTLAVAGLLTIAALAGCAHGPPAPAGALPAAGLHRLYRVSDGVFRSEQPNTAQFVELVRTYDIKSVIKLNTWLPGDGGSDDVPDGVSVYHHGWAPAGPVTRQQIIDALNDLEHVPRPVLVHCSHGEDRTGLLIGMYRFLHGSWAVAAYGEMLAFGFHPGLLGLKEAFERDTSWDAP